MSNYKLLATLSLINAIIGTIMCIPVANSFLSFGGVTYAAIIVISIIILIKSRGVPDAKKAGPILMLVASALGIISATIFLGVIGTTALSMAHSHVSQLTHGQVGGFLAGGIGMVLSQVVGWIIRVIGTIFSYIAYSKLSKDNKEV